MNRYLELDKIETRANVFMLSSMSDSCCSGSGFPTESFEIQATMKYTKFAGHESQNRACIQNVGIKMQNND